MLLLGCFGIFAFWSPCFFCCRFRFFGPHLVGGVSKMPKALAPWLQWDLSSQIWRLNSRSRQVFGFLWIILFSSVIFSYLLISSHVSIHFYRTFPWTSGTRSSEVFCRRPTWFAVCRPKRPRRDVTWRRGDETRLDFAFDLGLGLARRTKRLFWSHLRGSSIRWACLPAPYSLPLLATPCHSLPGLKVGHDWPRGVVHPVKIHRLPKNSRLWGRTQTLSEWKGLKIFWELLSQDGQSSDSSSFQQFQVIPFCEIPSSQLFTKCAKRFLASLTFALAQEILRTEVLLGVSLFSV